MDDQIGIVVRQLLDDKLEQLPEESKKFLIHLFTTKDGEALFQEWLTKQKQDNLFADINYNRIYLKIQQHVAVSAKSIEKNKRQPLHAVRALQRVAALLFIPLLGYVGYLAYRNHNISKHIDSMIATIAPGMQQLEYISPAGARLKVILPDSTEVWLNGNSRLMLSKSFGVGERGVSLRGQAFFHVKRNEHSPFIVKTGSINITALGTSFNVLAYPEEERVETVLISGKIAVNKEDKGVFDLSKEVILTPHQKASFNKESEALKVVNVYSEPYQSWTKGKLIFNDDPMHKVAEVLEHYYNVKIVINDPQILSYRFTATIEDSSIEQIMTYISYSSPVQYTIRKNLITITKK